MLGRGFQTMTVPALKVDGQRVQGSREISRAFDQIMPQPPLFPADPESRRAVDLAERCGEELQDLARRLVLCALGASRGRSRASTAIPTRSCARHSGSPAHS